MYSSITPSRCVRRDVCVEEKSKSRVRRSGLLNLNMHAYEYFFCTHTFTGTAVVCAWVCRTELERRESWLCVFL